MSQIKNKGIDWRDVFNMDRVLRSRGYEVSQIGQLSNTLLCDDNWTNEELQNMFQVMHQPVLRMELLNQIERHRSSSRDPLVDSLLKNPKFQNDRNRFSTSFEWYIGELLIKSFGAFSANFGVKVSNILRNSTGTDAGDFDVLAVLADLSLFYVEAKTGKLSREKVRKALERSLALHTNGVIILLSDKFDHKKFKPALEGLEHPMWGRTDSYESIQIKGDNESEIYLWCNSVYFVSANEVHGKLEPKIRMVLRDKGFKRSIVGFSTDISQDYQSAGYEYRNYLF